MDTVPTYGNEYDGSCAMRQMEQDKKEQLVLQHYNLVKYMALRLASRLPSNISVDDLFNTGVIGLLDAIDKFDQSQGIQFEIYARIRIRGAMLDEIRSMDWIPRSLRQKSSGIEKACIALQQKLGRYPSDEEVAEEMQISLDDYFKMLDEIKGISLLPEDVHEIFSESKVSHSLTTDSDELFKQAYRGELRQHLAEAIQGLSKKEQLVLSFYYFEELTMKEIGAVMGYTESRISQIHTKAILRLRTRLARKFKRDDLPDHVQQVEAGA